MRTPAVTRRRLLGLAALGAGALASPAILRYGRGRRPASGECFLSAYDDYRERHYVSAFDAEGRVGPSIPLTLRGHSAAPHPTRAGLAALIARRPGKQLFEIDFLAGKVQRVVNCAAQRHVYGHAVYAADGQLLLTTENDYVNGMGAIVIRDAATYAVIREMPSYEIGPHQLAMLSDDRTLVIANGGIRTHPAQPRRKLNRDAMTPSLAYINVESGELLAEYRLENRLLSIRHLSVGRDDQVAIAMQYEGPKSHLTPLVGFQRGGDAIQLAQAPAALLQQLNHYTASICLHPDSDIAAVTCPRGNQVTFWNAKTARLIRSLPIRDAGGVALNADRTMFVVTTGLGGIHRIEAQTLEAVPGGLVKAANTMWDNHLTHTLI